MSYRIHWKSLLILQAVNLIKLKSLLAVAADFMSVIHKTWFEKHSKIKNGLKSVWNSVLAQSHAERIKIVYDSYLENSIKESLRMQRAIEEPIEIMTLHLDLPVPSEIKKFWLSSINKETPTMVTIFFHYRSKRSTKKYCTKWLRNR